MDKKIYIYFAEHDIYFGEQMFTLVNINLELKSALRTKYLFCQTLLYFPWFQRMFLTFGGLGFLLGRCPSWCPVRLVMSRATHGVVSGRAICYNEILEKPHHHHHHRPLTHTL